jgi:hypothetical protein
MYACVYICCVFTLLKYFFVVFLSFFFSLFAPYFIMSDYFGYMFLGFRCMRIDVSCMLVAYLANLCTAALGVNRLSVWCSYMTVLSVSRGGAVEYGRRLILIFAEVAIY